MELRVFQGYDLFVIICITQLHFLYDDMAKTMQVHTCTVNCNRLKCKANCEQEMLKHYACVSDMLS